MQRPSADIMFDCEKLTVVSGVMIALTPPAMASDASPLRSPLHARCTATSDEEHAVSMVKLGPWVLRK